MPPFGNSLADYGQGRRRGGVRWWVLVLAALYMGYYYFSHQQAVPVTGRKQLVDIQYGRTNDPHNWIRKVF